MKRLTILLTVLTFTGFMLAACGGDSGTGPDPDNEDETTYTVDVSADDGGSVSPSGANEYDKGETAELMADPNDGYVFSGWTGDTESTDNPLSLTVDQDYKLTGNFEKKTYALTTNTEGDGAINEKVVQEKSTDYESGTVVELTANPGEGYKFVEWKGDLSGTDNPQQITVDNPKEVTAVFERKSYALTTNIEGEGAVYETVIQQKTTNYDYGTVVELEAKPSTGWEFTGWQGDLTGSSNPEQVTVTQSATITAEFVLLNESSRPAFYLAENGVTIKCEDASIGDTGMVDGEEYTKRSAAEIDTDNATTTCTSGITNMREIFSDEDTFNGDISHWDVSDVTDMYSMFKKASSFNGDLSNWDVSSVTDMNWMFYDADAFNQDIGSWDISSVKYMRRMFQNASSFNQDLNNWDVTSVTTMYAMFHGASSFNEDIGDWDVSGVENMGRMFYKAPSFNQNISSWDVSNVTTMGVMFYEASSFDQDLNDWNVSSVTDMSYMFNNAIAFNGDLSSWDVSNVTDMDGMFDFATSFNQDISGWCVSNISSEPTDFSKDSPLSESKKPEWGMCPGS